MVEEELLIAFKRLDINEKRNQLSLELEKLVYLLDSVHQQFNIEKLPSSIHTYNKAADENISQESYIELLYENVIFLRKDILTLVNALLKNNNSNL